jgi:glycosyltransferase involved in cell wall biosynthesis
MKLVFFSNYLNHHQVMVADELYKLIGKEFAFVATMPVDKDLLKGGVDYSTKRDYCVRAYSSEQDYNNAIQLALNAEVCVFGADALEYEKNRALESPEGLSFEISERWLKRGWLNLASPRILKRFIYYYRYFKKAKFNRLAAGAFTAQDDKKLGVYKGRSFKWGYFTEVSSEVSGFFDKRSGRADYMFHASGKSNETLSKIEENSGCAIRLMWCARFIDWKHPEMPIRLAMKLKDAGYDYHLDMYGDGALRPAMEELSREFNVAEYITFHGNIPNSEIHQAMRDHDIFLFTSDRQEGWGAVANEAMSEGCVLVGSDEIGAVPYLVKHKETGMIFRSGDQDSLYEQVKYLLDNPDVRKQISKAGRESMVKLWSPANAAKSLLRLIKDIQAGHETSIVEGPCSKA